MNPNYFKANFKIAIKSKKNFLLVCLLIIFMTFFLFVVESQEIGDGVRQWRDYAESVQVNTDYFDGSSLRNKHYKQTYDNLNKFPLVLPSIGYWNIVNPCQGIATSCATSTPGFNLREVNTALIRLLQNPNASFDELYCVPDFPTGGYLINPAEVRQSLKQGQGKSCRLRAKIDYDGKRNVLVITEVPYSVFTNTIMKQVRQIITEDETCDIDKITDFTGEKCLIEIQLKKNANPATILRRLYKA